MALFADERGEEGLLRLPPLPLHSLIAWAMLTPVMQKFNFLDQGSSMGSRVPLLSMFRYCLLLGLQRSPIFPCQGVFSLKVKVLEAQV